MSSSSWVNALLGAVVTVLLSFTLVSPLIGGTVAGYLNQDSGLRIGVISGIFVAMPMLMLGIVIFGLLPARPSTPSGVEIVVSVIFLVVAPIYLIGLSAVGGYLGVYFHDRLEGSPTI